jgi:hypothetical protein
VSVCSFLENTGEEGASAISANGNMSVVHCTVVRNEALSDVSSEAAVHAASGNRIDMFGCVVAQNTSNNTNPGISPDVSAVEDYRISSQGGNIIGNLNGNGLFSYSRPTDIIGDAETAVGVIDPQLEQTLSNDFTPVLYPTQNSIARDVVVSEGNDVFNTTPTQDQLGIKWTNKDSRIPDAGAAEYGWYQVVTAEDNVKNPTARCNDQGGNLDQLEAILPTTATAGAWVPISTDPELLRTIRENKTNPELPLPAGIRPGAKTVVWRTDLQGGDVVNYDTVEFYFLEIGEIYFKSGDNGN